MRSISPYQSRPGPASRAQTLAASGIGKTGAVEPRRGLGILRTAPLGRGGAALWLCAAAVSSQHVVLHNRSDSRRAEVVRVSLPLRRGEVDELPAVRIGAELAACVPMQRWPDGSLALVEAQWRQELEPRQMLLALVSRDGVASRPTTHADAGAFPFPADIPLRSELVDPWGRTFVARLQLDRVEAGPLIERRRFTSVHAGTGGERSLGLVAHLTRFAGERRAQLVVVLENAQSPHTKAPVLGPVRLSSWAVCSEDERLRLLPRARDEQHLAVPVPLPGGGWKQTLLGPSSQLWLGDRTAKALRFDLFWDDGSATEAERAAARLASDCPLFALPDLETVRASGAFGAHGGPAPLLAADTDAARSRLVTARRRSPNTPFSGFGNVEDAAAQGTPRNGPSALHDVVRYASAELLGIAESMATQETLRPSPGVDPRLPAGTAALRAGLPLSLLEAPHGWTALDYEHFTVDLLYDFWWLTNDPLARDEIARAAAGLRALLPAIPFLTSRGEGWCLQAGSLAALALGDASLLELLRDRALHTIAPILSHAPPHVAIPQPPHQEALGPATRFDAPWQMAALVHGLSALHRATDDARIPGLVTRVAAAMAGPGWVEGQGPKYLVSEQDPGRYMLPVGTEPLEGTAYMEIGAFVLAKRFTQDEQQRALFTRRAAEIVMPWQVGRIGAQAANPWFQLWLASEEEGR